METPLYPTFWRRSSANKQQSLFDYMTNNIYIGVTNFMKLCRVLCMVFRLMEHSILVIFILEYGMH